MFNKQMLSLLKIEFLKSIRTKSNIFMFIVLPVLIWLLIFGFTHQNANKIGFAGEEFYIFNLESDTDHMGDLLIERLQKLTESNVSIIYQSIMVPINYEFTELSNFYDYVRRNGLTPMVLIHQNFSQLYNEYSDIKDPVANVELLLLQDSDFGNAIQYVVSNILDSSPFTLVKYEHAVSINYNEMVDQSVNVEDTSNQQMIIFLSIYAILLAPTFFIAHTFTDEREKMTIEAILTLPLTKSEIITAKIANGTIFGLIFSLISTLCLGIFAIVVNSEFGNREGLSTIEISMGVVLIYFLFSSLTIFIAISLGIALIVTVKDKKVAEQAYIIGIMFPAVITPILMDIYGSGQMGLIYLLPWTHSIQLLNKFLYPHSSSSELIFNSLIFDLIFHVIGLISIITVSLWFAIRRFEKNDEYN